jgi:NADH-ubiquinone oxidoreductase chain 3
MTVKVCVRLTLALSRLIIVYCPLPPPFIYKFTTVFTTNIHIFIKLTSLTFFFLFIPTLALILLGISILFSPHNPHQEKNSAFECVFRSFLDKIYKIKLHQVTFGFIIVTLVSLIKYSFSIYSSDLSGNILIGLLCFISRLLFIDSLKDVFNNLEINLDLKQFIWGYQSLDGGVNNNTLSKNTIITNKLYMDNNNGTQSSSGNTTRQDTRPNRIYNTVPQPLTFNDGRIETYHDGGIITTQYPDGRITHRTHNDGIQSSSSNTTQEDRRYNTRSAQNNTIQVNTASGSRIVRMNTIVSRAPDIAVPNDPPVVGTNTIRSPDLRATFALPNDPPVVGTNTIRSPDLRGTFTEAFDQTDPQVQQTADRMWQIIRERQVRVQEDPNLYSRNIEELREEREIREQAEKAERDAEEAINQAARAQLRKEEKAAEIAAKIAAEKAAHAAQEAARSAAIQAAVYQAAEDPVERQRIVERTLQRYGLGKGR